MKRVFILCIMVLVMVNIGFSLRNIRNITNKIRIERGMEKSSKGVRDIVKDTIKKYDGNVERLKIPESKMNNLEAKMMFRKLRTSNNVNIIRLKDALLYLTSEVERLESRFDKNEERVNNRIDSLNQYINTILISVIVAIIGVIGSIIMSMLKSKKESKVISN